MKQRLIRIGILAAVFIVAATLFGLMTNKGKKGATVSMATPALPRLSFGCQGYIVNPLSGYAGEIDEGSVHGDILPLDASGTVTMYVTTYEKAIDKLKYEVRSLDTGKALDKGKINVTKDPDQQLVAYKIELGEVFEKLGKDTQAMLVVKADVDDETVTYFIRVVMPDPTTTKACLDFAVNVHDQTMNPSEEGTLESMLETADLDNQSLDYVTIESDYDYVVWQNQKPQTVGNITWYIHEANSTSTSLTMRYKVMLTGTGDDTIYTVNEFYRIRGSGKQMYLLDFIRRLDHDPEDTSLKANDSGIDLGITDLNQDTMYDAGGNIAVFVQNEAVYEYNKKKNTLIRVFGYTDELTGSFPPDNQRRDIKVLKVTKGGDAIFSVAGYVPRGEHEGRVGLALYQYNYEKNYVAEILFVPSKLSYEVARDNLNSCLCYGGEDATYYLLVDQKLYRLRIGTGNHATQKEIASGITDDKIAIADDASRIAYVDGEGTIRVHCLKNNEKYKVKAEGSDAVEPIGFIGADLAYGSKRASDTGKMADGRDVEPFYKVTIRNKENKELMTYQKDRILMRDAHVENATLTLERIQKSGSSYVDIADDYIQENKAVKESMIERMRIDGEDGISRVHLVFSKGLSGKKPKFLSPKQSYESADVDLYLTKNGYQDRYYVFGCGTAVGGYDLPGEAIVSADEFSGLVTKGSQSIFWERGNRDLIYTIPNMKMFKAASGQSAKDACIKHLYKMTGAKKTLDLSECKVEQTLYLVNHGRPVIVLTQGDGALMIYSYSETTVNCVDPKNGARISRTFEQIDKNAKALLTADQGAD